MSVPSARTPRLPSTVKPSGELRREHGRWHMAVMALDSLPGPVVEIVRLRAAQHHDCHT